jgi:glycosyltransferase involved in cell wall biosynthesis
MRILYHHRTLADGAEGIHIQEMVEAFTGLGHEVEVDALASGSSRGEGHAGVWARIKRALPGPLFELAAAAFNVVDYLRFSRRLRVCRPDFVYKRHAIYDIGVILASRHAGVPVVLEVNRPYSLQRYAEFEPLYFPKLAALFERGAVRHSTLVAAVSSPLRDFLDDMAGTPGRTRVVPNGANPERFQFDAEARSRIRSRFGLADEVVVGWAGILREWHRVDLLLAATAALPGIRTMIVGDGPDRERLSALAVRLGILDRVIFTGRVSHAQMPDFVAAMDIAVASDDRTGVASPMKLLEYMAVGRAVVAPRLANIQDFIEDGVDGALFTPGDPRALADVLSTLASDAARRHAMGTRARRKIEQERNWRRNAEVVLAALRSTRSGDPTR